MLAAEDVSVLVCALDEDASEDVLDDALEAAPSDAEPPQAASPRANTNAQHRAVTARLLLMDMETLLVATFVSTMKATARSVKRIGSHLCTLRITAGQEVTTLC